MSRITDRLRPTRGQRAAILLASHLLTLACLVACTTGPGPAVPPAGGTAAALPSARADVTVIGNGYVVHQREWQPAAPTPATSPPAPRR